MRRDCRPSRRKLVDWPNCIQAAMALKSDGPVGAGRDYLILTRWHHSLLYLNGLTTQAAVNSVAWCLILPSVPNGDTTINDGLRNCRGWLRAIQQRTEADFFRIMPTLLRFDNIVVGLKNFSDPYWNSIVAVLQQYSQKNLLQCRKIYWEFLNCW